MAVMFTYPQTAATLFIQVPQTKVGGEGLPRPFRGSRGREGLVGSGVTLQRASVQEGSKAKLGKMVVLVTGGRAHTGGTSRAWGRMR